MTVEEACEILGKNAAERVNQLSEQQLHNFYKYLHEKETFLGALFKAEESK